MTTCCVEGCGKTFSSEPANVDIDNPQYPHLSHSVSFHRFPRKKALRQKWLKAIGQPDWDAPITAHVCSQHFSCKQLVYLSNSSYKVKDDGYPDSALPILFFKNVDASTLKVCRFCLATNIKMFSLQAGVLKTCLESIVGLHENHDVDGLPQYLCYICSAYLLKMYNVMEKSIIAQATLLEIYAENLEITKNLIFEENRQKLNLVHTLQSHNTTPCTVYEYRYNDDLNVSVLITDKLESDKIENDNLVKENSSGDMSESESEFRAKRLNNICRKLKQDVDESNILTEICDEPFPIDIDISETQGTLDNSNVPLSSKSTKLKDEHFKDINTTNRNENTFIQEYIKLESFDSDDETTTKYENSTYMKEHDYSRVYIDNNNLRVTADDFIKGENIQEYKNNRNILFSTQTDNIKIREVKSLRHADETILSRNSANEIPCLDQYYDIEELTLDKQKHQWLRSIERPSHPLEQYRCGICSKWVRGGKFYSKHIARHDPQCGEYACGVCKVRFKKEHLLKKHIVMIHSRKYICKICPTVIYTITGASHHRLKHGKSRFQCIRCVRSFGTSTGLRVHVTAIHHTAPRLKSKNQFVCNACNLSFTSQMAQQEHWFACSAKETTPSLLEAACVSSTCNRCGQLFSSRERLDAHKRTLHGVSGHRRYYPNKCEHCNVILRSRVHQRAHMLKLHPDAYRKMYKDPRRSARLERKVQARIFSRDSKDKLEKNVHSTPRRPVRQHVVRNKRNKTFRNTKRKIKRVPPVKVSYECPICDNVFGTTGMLNQHILNAHQRLQFTKTVDSPTGDGYDKHVKIKKNRISIKGDSETETCSEGKERSDDDQEIIKARNKDPVRGDSNSYGHQKDYAMLNTLYSDFSEENIKKYYIAI